MLLEWTHVAGAEKYHLYRNGVYRTTIQDTGGNQRFHDPGVANRSAYSYRIVAESSDGRESQADTAAVTYLEPARATVFEEQISWNANGRHSVYSGTTGQFVCNSATECRVDPGIWRVKNTASGLSTNVRVSEPSFVTVDHATLNGETETVFHSKYGSFIFTKNGPLGSSPNAQTTTRDSQETMWLNYNPTRYDTPEDQTHLSGGTAFEYEVNPDGTRGDLVSVSRNGQRLTPEEWEVESANTRDHFLTNFPATKPITVVQIAYTVWSKVKEVFGGGSDDNGGGDSDFEPNSIDNNWGWGDHPQGEFGGTPTVNTGGNSGGNSNSNSGGDSNSNSNSSNSGSNSNSGGSHPTGYDDVEDTGGTF